jgi:thiol-disulfide isomerase/thioredoxin
MALAIGDSCPPFVLPGTDGKTHSLDDAKGKLLVVVVSCNHCPYVMAYEPRLVALAREYAAKAVDFVAVNGNDATRYPDDGMEAMRVRAEARGFPFPYVRDDSQVFVRTLGARFTPEIFVFDGARTLRYHGRIDDNHRDLAQVTTHDLRNALDELLQGRPVPVAETTAFGCSIKWK